MDETVGIRIVARRLTKWRNRIWESFISRSKSTVLWSGGGCG